MIYWLTGVIGAGKSTLGAALAATMPDTFFIDGDYLGEIIEADMETFQQKINRKHELLAQVCVNLAAKSESVVIAYPINKHRAALIRDKLPTSQLLFIGIEAPAKTDTRTFTDWEITQKNLMQDCTGKEFADIYFTHPSPYLHDSLTTLLQKLSKA